MGRQLEAKGIQAEQGQEQEVSNNQDIEGLETSGDIDVDGIDPGERAEVNALLNFDSSIRASFDIGSNIGEDAARAVEDGLDDPAGPEDGSVRAAQDRSRESEAVLQAGIAALNGVGSASIRESYTIGSNIGEDTAAILNGVGGASIRESYTIGSNIGEDAAIVAEEAREAMKGQNGLAAQDMSRGSEAVLSATKAAMGLDAESEIIDERSGMATQSMERQNEAALSAMKAAMGFDAGTGVSNNDSVRANQESTRASEAVLEAAAAAVLNAKKDEFE